MHNLSTLLLQAAMGEPYRRIVKIKLPKFIQISRTKDIECFLVYIHHIRGYMTSGMLYITTRPLLHTVAVYMYIFGDGDSAVAPVQFPSLRYKTKSVSTLKQINYILY